MSITSVDSYVAALGRGVTRYVTRRDNAFTIVTGQFASLWLGTGIPGPGVAPGAAAVPTKATAGSICNFTNPGGGESAHIFEVDYSWDSSSTGTVYIYDRLVHHGGESGTDTSLRTVNTPALTRGDSNGLRVQGFVECYQDLGVTTRTLTVTYTNTAGTGSRTATVTIPANFRAGRILPIFPLQADDIGIKSIETIQLSGTTGTAGSYGVTLGRRLLACAPMELTAIQQTVRSQLELGLPKLEADACLWLVIFTETTSLGALLGGLMVGTTGTAGPIATDADYVAAVTSRAQSFDIYRNYGLNTASGQFSSSWIVNGIPAVGVTPGAAAVPTKATAGALVNFANPGGGEAVHIHQVELLCDNACPIDIFDRLVHHGGASGTDVSLVAVNTPAITRGDTNGGDVVGFVECYVQLGGVSQTLTISYTNSAGTPARITTVTIPATMRVSRLLPIPLLSGDFGIKSIETIQLGGSTGAVGSYGVTLARRVVVMPTRTDGVQVRRTGKELGLCRIEPDACLFFVSLANAAGAPSAVSGTVTIVTSG